MIGRIRRIGRVVVTGGAAGRSGFTLLELLVVMGIIGLLIGLLMPVLGRARLMARKTRAQSEVRQIEMAIKGYLEDYRDLSAFNANFDLVGGSDELAILRGGNSRGIVYLEVSPDMWDNGFLDPWGTPYRVAVDDDLNVPPTPRVTIGGETLELYVAVMSAGPDRDFDTMEDNIMSWKP